MKGKKRETAPLLVARWVQKDFIVIIICIGVLFVCAYSLYIIGDYQQKCNEHWQQELKNKCTCGFMGEFNDPVNYMPLINMEGYYDKENNSQDT